MKLTHVASLLLLVGISANSYAQTEKNIVSSSNQTSQEEVQDMSDPLAVYTQAGFGISDKGLNLKVGRSYDTGSENDVAMNLIEIKGIAGEQLGWSGNSERDDSIDSVRFRNFAVNKLNGRGKQIDLNYDVENEELDASYSFIQALPKFGPIQLYPLAGVGARIMNGQLDKTVEADGESYQIDKSMGYTIPGVYGVIGMYSRITITDHIWVNYNPMWLTSIAGSDGFVDQGFAGDSNVWTNEVSVGYQFTPRFNARYFANWNQHQDYFEGDQRIEFNYQF